MTKTFFVGLKNFFDPYGISLANCNDNEPITEEAKMSFAESKQYMFDKHMQECLFKILSCRSTSHLVNKILRINTDKYLINCVCRCSKIQMRPGF